MATKQRRIYNCLPSQNQDRDWQIETAREAGALAAASLPDSIDLRADWWTINNQGTTGSCVGWSVGDSVIRWHMVQAGQLQPDEQISVRYIWMAAKETDEFNQKPSTFIETDGTSLKAALDVARKCGVVIDRLLPFRSGKLYNGKLETFYLIAAQRRITVYINLSSNLNRWREWIANNGPIATRLDVDSAFESAKATSAHLTAYQYPGQPQGHAVALVGYTPDGFIIRNSWGTSWGDKGFAYASNAYAQAAFTEAYGVLI